jgi:hypothetical protein
MVLCVQTIPKTIIHAPFWILIVEYLKLILYFQICDHGSKQSCTFNYNVELDAKTLSVDHVMGHI